jgi:hypothetical protein
MLIFLQVLHHTSLKTFEMRLVFQYAHSANADSAVDLSGCMGEQNAMRQTSLVCTFYEFSNRLMQISL